MHGTRWAVAYFFPVKLLESLPFTILPRVYPVYSRVYQDLLKIPYLISSRDPTQDFLIRAYWWSSLTLKYLGDTRQR